MCHWRNARQGIKALHRGFAFCKPDVCYQSFHYTEAVNPSLGSRLFWFQKPDVGPKCGFSGLFYSSREPSSRARIDSAGLKCGIDRHGICRELCEACMSFCWTSCLRVVVFWWGLVRDRVICVWTSSLCFYSGLWWDAVSEDDTFVWTEGS